MTSKKIINSSELRKALGTFATGVTVVTASSDNGELAGVTVNSFTSVSLSPPLVLWCLASTSESLNIFRSAEYFAVNILASDQLSLSNHFATKQEDKFKSISFHHGHGDVPLLDGCMTRLQCRTTQHYEAGDHWIIIGEVIDLMTTTKEGLIFNQSNYGISLPLPSAESEEENLNEPPGHESESYFSLLFQAIHSYHEKFEHQQKQIIDSDYEARVLTVLNKADSATTADICKVIKVPKSDMQLIIDELISRGLVENKSKNGQDSLQLSGIGKDKSDQLLLLIQEHDDRVNGLLGDNAVQQFRDNLKKIIDWKD